MVFERLLEAMALAGAALVMGGWAVVAEGLMR